MEHLLQFGLSNALAAAVLAVLATVATRIWRNPHFAYALWFVVLLRLAAPPLLPVGVPVPQWMSQRLTRLARDAAFPSDGNYLRRLPADWVNGPAPMVGSHSLEEHGSPPLEVALREVAQLPPQPVGAEPTHPSAASGSDHESLPSTSLTSRPRTTEVKPVSTALVTRMPAPEVRGDPERAPSSDSLSMANIAARVWLSGTLCYLLLTTLRVRTFARVLGRARR